MRIILTIIAFLIAHSAGLTAQNDFKTLDLQTYDCYMKGDYKNLKKTGDILFSQGIDYYYLRIRLGILSYNNQLYSTSSKHFNKALEFNSSDTISRKYIYYSYLFSGRKTDASLYLESIPSDKKIVTLKSSDKPGFSNLFAGSSASGSEVTLYSTNNLYYEAVKNSLSIYAGFEGNFSARLKGTFAYTYYRKDRTVYSDLNPSGRDLYLRQNQVYARLSYNIFPGWEFSGFSHIAFYNDAAARAQQGNGGSTSISVTEYLIGAGMSKNGWKIRTGANFSFSNFSNSNQFRCEGYLTYLPSGNLNIYFTSGGMYQNDKNWGSTYQVNQEIGFKILKSLWMESGIVLGNSFLYARNQGYVMNNSYQTPATTIYGNIIILPGKKFSLTLTPFYSENQIYSWDLNANTRTNKVTLNSFGGAIKIIYKNS